MLLFAATVGLELDRLIARAQSGAPARALLLQAIGAERIEALADAVGGPTPGRTRRSAALAVRPRFSPGYGDLPLALQREIFAALDCPRRIGLTLGGSLLMTPHQIRHRAQRRGPRLTATHDTARREGPCS